ncbi:MAG: hypothetical protein ACKO40_08440 [Planctomycetaceae bacterium]
MADDQQPQRRSPMNIDTVMLALSFVALSIGCLILALDLFMRRMPLSPVPPQ